MQRQDLIRHIINHLPAGSLKGLDSKGQQVVQFEGRDRRTRTFATLEMLPKDRLDQLAMQLSEMVL